MIGDAARPAPAEVRPMTDDRPPADASWPEPPSCPSCRAPNHLGASACWLCGAELPPPPDRPASAAVPAPAVPEPPAGQVGPRPRLSIGTLMVVIGVVSVFLAVGGGRAEIGVGLALILGPAVGYLVARVRRVRRGEQGGAPSAAERLLGDLAATILVVSLASAALAAVLLIAAHLLRAAAGAP